jgi:hypothetical protein
MSALQSPEAEAALPHREAGDRHPHLAFADGQLRDGAQRDVLADRSDVAGARRTPPRSVEVWTRISSYVTKPSWADVDMILVDRDEQASGELSPFVLRPQRSLF